MTTGRTSNEAWGSRIGLILAMAGNAVGLGNFLRFPVQAASNGGGSFMITYFIALLLLGIPLMWIEWGIGRNGGRYRKGHMPGMFAAIWHHPGGEVPRRHRPGDPAGRADLLHLHRELDARVHVVLADGRLLRTRRRRPRWSNYLQSFQGVGDPATRVHAPWTPYAFFIVTLADQRLDHLEGDLGRRREAGAHRHADPVPVRARPGRAWCSRCRPGPTARPPGPASNFIYARTCRASTSRASGWRRPDRSSSRCRSAWAGCRRTPPTSRRKDDIALNGIATAATNETAEVVLGGTIAIPAAVVFFGVSGAMAVAQSGSFNLGFATMPVVFQQLPLGTAAGRHVVRPAVLRRHHLVGRDADADRGVLPGGVRPAPRAGLLRRSASRRFSSG